MERLPAVAVQLLVGQLPAVRWPLHGSACPAGGSSLPTGHCNQADQLLGSKLKKKKKHFGFSSDYYTSSSYAWTITTMGAVTVAATLLCSNTTR